MDPIEFDPQFVSMIWGGRRLQTVFGKGIPNGSIGESWEISGHRAHLTMVSSGEYIGQNIYDLAQSAGEDVFGPRAHECAAEFPLLYKLLDASKVLSVQVHPDDAYARDRESALGKSEAWIIIDCEPGSVVYRGFRDGASLEDFDSLLQEARLEEILRPVEVSPGDCIDVPARTVHAIGEGILLAEIQQSSDLTYRVYDWNRMGADGKPRELHVEKARDVMDFTGAGSDKVMPETITADGGAHQVLVSSDKFVLERFLVDSSMDLSRPVDGFRVLSALEGSGTIAWDGGEDTLEAGDSLLIPASLGAITLSTDSSLTAIRAYVP